MGVGGCAQILNITARIILNLCVRWIPTIHTCTSPLKKKETPVSNSLGVLAIFHIYIYF